MVPGARGAHRKEVQTAHTSWDMLPPVCAEVAQSGIGSHTSNFCRFAYHHRLWESGANGCLQPRSGLRRHILSGKAATHPAGVNGQNMSPE
jgi:hypothetical protein